MKRKNLVRKITLMLAFLALFHVGRTQESAIFKEQEREYKTGLHLFDMHQYNAAMQHFENVKGLELRVAKGSNAKEHQMYLIQSEYYAALCALELFHSGAEKKLIQFTVLYPEHPLAKNASFDLGNFYYRQKNFDKAVLWYAKTNKGLLGKNAQVEYDFRYGYALYEEKDFEKASDLFSKVIPKNSKYSYPAAYYDGLIQFDAKNYPKAIERFTFIQDSKTYASVAPYYLSSIYFAQKDYDKVLSLSKTLDTQTELKNIDQIYLMAGASAFAKKDWSSAITNYESAGKKNKLEDLGKYQLGYAYFQTQNYQKSIEWLKSLADGNGTYAQHALYLMGQAFYQLKDKPSARNAFLKASKLVGEEFIAANSLLSYAKLSFELNFYQTAIESLQDFLEKYPKNEEVEEAQALLAESFLYTRNYRQAVEILEALSPRTTRANLAYQKVSYFRAMELFNENKFAESLQLINKSLQFPLDKKIQALSYFWKAECYAQLSNQEEAIKYYAQFNNLELAPNTEPYALAQYGMGYAYFKKEDYKSSIVYFDKFLKLESKSKEGSKRSYDATLRLADGYFVIKEYDKALFNYNKIINEKQAGADYASFQKGMILGLQGKQNDKIITLKNLLNQFPKSSYADDATYEIGNGYFVMSNTADAIVNFNTLIQNFANSRYVSKARLSLGLIYYAESQDEKAIGMYKAIIADYPGTEEAKEALQAIKNIYIDAGNAEAYLSYVKTLPFASVSEGAQDSISYQAANNRYLLGDCENAINGLNKYLEKFPNGNFSTEAHAHRADCFMRSKNTNAAILDYEYLISIGNPKYIERALSNASKIYMKDQKYKEASLCFVQLEEKAEFKENYADAIAGAMYSFNALNDTINTLKYADRILAFEKSSLQDQYNAHLFKAKAYYAQKNIDLAAQEFNAVAKMTKTEAGAEAKYYNAVILFEKGKYLDAQQACFDLSNQVPAYEFWVAKGFIILAQTYNKLGNDFQAKSTLQSIIDEYGDTNDGVIDEAKKKLEELNQNKQ